MTDRDRQLMGMLATVRYLSGEQLQRLLFMERSDINRKKRLAALGGEGKHGLEPAYLKRLSYRSWDCAVPRRSRLDEAICPGLIAGNVG